MWFDFNDTSITVEYKMTVNQGGKVAGKGVMIGDTFDSAEVLND